MIGQQISHFKLIEKLGEGGMGIIYRAEDENLGRQVALKVLPPGFAGDPERQARFMREARMAAAVTHPNIATIHEVGEDKGVVYIAMELVEGESVADLIAREALSTDDALSYAVMVADGLARAHAAGIVHRDLKPDNVMITAGGHAKILDFGLAKPYESPLGDGGDDLQTISANMTREGRILGTVAYMSPEQARGLPLDFRSDLFSLGTLIYETATGQSPFRGETITDTLSAILRDRQPPIAEHNQEVPAELERILDRCLKKDPADRYQDTEGLLRDLRELKRASDSRSLPRVSLSGEQAFYGEPGRRPIWLGILAAVALVTAFILPKMFTDGPAPTSARERDDSLAVMPFEHLQDSRDSERLGQILQELIIADLSEAASLKVFSSQRLFDVQKQLGRTERTTIDRDMATDVAVRAGASTMLTGSLSRLDDRWILTSNLIDVADGAVIKSERMDGPDLYAMVDQLTPLIRRDLGIDVGGGELAVRDRTSSSIEALQAYLDGVVLLNDLKFARASEQFARAITVDPTFGQAHYKLAISRWWGEDIGLPFDRGEQGPAAVLRGLLSSDFKLNRKDRMLAGATLALVERRFEEAQTLFEEILEEFPDEKEAWYGLGEARFHSPGGYGSKQTNDTFEEAIRLDPSFRLAYYHVVDYLELKGRFDEGLARLETLIAQDPDDPSWHQERARLLVSKGDDQGFDEVAEGCMVRMSDAGDKSALLLKAAEAYYHRGVYAKQERLLTQAYDLDPDGASAQVLSGLGWSNLELGRHEEAADWFDRARATGSTTQRMISGMIRLRLVQGRTEQAIDLANEYAETAPESVIAAAHRVEAYVVSSRSEDADRILASALSERDGEAKRWDLLKRVVPSYLAAGRLERAESLVREALETGLTTQNAAAHGLLGWILTARENFDQARVAYDRAFELDPNSFPAFHGGVTLDVLTGDLVTAEQRLDTQLTTRADRPDIRRLMAQALEGQGRYREAEAHARRAVEMAPTRKNLTLLSWIMIAGDLDVEEGFEMAQRAMATPPGYHDQFGTLPIDPSPEHCLGLAHLERQEYAEAVTALEKAGRLRPDRPAILEHLREAERKRGAGPRPS